jgi:uncharacterized protein with HEPN domain
MELLKPRDKDIITHIIRYCSLIDAARSRFGDSREEFAKDTDYQGCCTMYLLQIGELVSHLSDEFKDGYQSIPWRNIRGLRNIVAHDYALHKM